MSAISKQALLVDNSTSFPNNNAGEITPSDLRAFNVNVIDSTVNQTEYTTNSGSWNNSINALNTFSASQQPSFNALNSFTSSQLVINSGVNSFTQSADGRLDVLENDTANLEAFTASINEIRDDGVLQGYSTRLFFEGLVSASITQNVDGPIATIKVEQDGSKLSTASFNEYTASNAASQSLYSASVSQSLASLQSEIDGIELSAATTGSNIFTGNQYVNGFVSASAGFYSGPNTTALNIGDGANIRFWSGSTGGADYYNIQLVPGVGDIAFSRSGAGNVKVMTLAGVAGNNTSFQNNPVIFNDTVSFLTVNAQSTAISGSGSYSLQASSISNTAPTATTTATSSFIGTVSITGQSGNDGRAIMLGHSGSLVLGNSSTNTYYGAIAHLSSSASNANTNLIFKNSTATADTIVSGSANIFVNPAAPTAGFKRYVGTSNIFTHASSVPQISGSMAWSPAINGNIFSHTQTNALTFRGAVSSSAGPGILHNIFMGGALNLGTSAANNFEKAVAGVGVGNNAVFGGTINMVAKDTTLTNAPVVSANLLFGSTLSLNLQSSSVTYASNIQNGTVTVNNAFLPISGTLTAALSPRVTLNTVYGHQHVINMSGSNTATNQSKTYYANILAGMFLSSSMTSNSDANHILATGLIGNALVVTGSSTAASMVASLTPDSTQGSLFVGRFNDGTGTKASTAETVFAVGTGTTSVRKTGFLIDSGSNTIVDGSLTITGSAKGNVVSASIVSSTASIDLSRGDFFTLVLSGSISTNINITNAQPGTTAMIRITNDGINSASFSSNVKQAKFNSYIPTSGSNTIDLLSITAFDTGSVYVTKANNFI